ncbi:peptidoglycan-binding protein [Candidatus Wolfebacteria bacterium]|nr:peptidoglycan-binding protein [Candidatus Wolfebacteria bacterium]
MNKKILVSAVFLAAFLFLVGVVNYAEAAAPQIAQVKFKAAGDSNKIVVIFDQPVFSTASGTGALAGEDFILGGSAGSGQTINPTVDHGVMPPSNVVVLTISTNVNATAPGQWTLAASSTSIFNTQGEAAITAAMDLVGQGDSTAPSVLAVVQHSSMNLDVMFSEPVSSLTGATTTRYINLTTSNATDTPSIAAASLVPEKTIGILTVASSTVLGWGSGNSIDVGSVEDLVGNPMATTTKTILPPIKISEVKAGTSSNIHDEFVELHNFGDSAIIFSTSTLFLHINNGSDVLKNLTVLRNQIPEHGYYLIGSSLGYSGTTGLDASYDSSSNDITANSGVYISASSTADTGVIDLIGMGGSAIKETATTTALAAGKSYERKAFGNSTTSTMAGGGDEFKGNTQDSDNNSQDFILRDAPQAQNSASPKEFPFTGMGQSENEAPMVTMSFPGGNPGEIIPSNINFAGFNFNKPVQENSVTTSTVLLQAGGAGANLCSSVQFSNSPAPGTPSGKCNISGSLAVGTSYTFTILGGASGVQDFNSNDLNQPSGNHGVSGNYVITFTLSSEGGGGMTFQAPPVFMMGTMPFPGSVNIPSNIQKIFVKFSGNISTSTIITSNFQLRKVSDNSSVSLSSATSTAGDKGLVSDLVVLNLGGSLIANTEYKITASNLLDTSGRAVNGYEPRFTTGSADATGPAVVGKLPNITTGVPVNAIDIHVMTDDKIDSTTITADTIKLKLSGNVLPSDVDFDPFTGEIILLANNVFLPSASYTVSINATGTVPCISNIVGLCLQDTDGVTDGLYEFSFTTGGADTQSPQIIFSNADQRFLSITFDEPINKLEAETLDNYVLVAGGATSTLSSLAGQSAKYDNVGRTTVIENLNLPSGADYTVTVSNVHDLSGNVIGVQNYAQGTVQSMSNTGGFVGPGGPSPDMMSQGGGGGGGPMPTNFSSASFGFVPEAEVRPFAPMVGVQTTYMVGVPISQQIKNNAGGGKIVLTFPTGFDVSGATLDAYSPMNNDVNGPGPGVITVNAVTANSSARTVTITLNQNSRCGNGNSTPCSGDAHDFLKLDISGIINSSIPKDGASGGYTIDVKTMNGSTVLESMTSKSFYLTAGGSNTLGVSLTASGAANGATTTIRMMSPLTGPRATTTSAFSSGQATAVFTGLIDGDYYVYTDPIVSLSGVDYIGKAMPSGIWVSGGAVTTTITFTPTAGLTTVTVNITAPAGKNIDVFANSGEKFFVKTLTTTGGTDSATLKLSDGTWNVGVGPAMPTGPYSGPPPAPDFVMQPPVQVIISGSNITENSGSANDGTLVFNLSAANKTLTGTVVDSSGRAMATAEVFAYSPMGGFGTHGTTQTNGSFSLNVGLGLYQVGAFVPGLPPAQELAVEVLDSGFLVNGQSTTSILLKLYKPERTISGKVLDQNNNPIQGAGVFAYCDPSVIGNACFGPGDHTGSPTESDGSYTLYVKNGTWRVGAFLPGFGELPQVQKVVSGSDLSNVNFSPSSNTSFRNISGTVCKDDDATGNTTTCGSGDTKLSGVFIRAFSVDGANQSVTDQSGNYSVRVPASTYTVEAFSPNFGRLAALSNVVVTTSTDVTGKDVVIGNPRTITINVKDAGGDFVTASQLYLDFYDFTSNIGNHLEIKNATSGIISLSDGNYKVRASVPGKSLGEGAVLTDNATTTVVVSSTLAVNGTETIKVVLPSLITVNGTVYSGSVDPGNIVGGAMVNFTDPANGIFISTQTATSGVYALKLPSGTYNAVAQKPGYFGSSVQVIVGTSTVTQNFIINQGTYNISGLVTVAGATSTRGYVRAAKLGGGFAGAEIDSTGAYTLKVNPGTWRVYASAEGYSETEYSSPVEIVSASASNININLTATVTLAAPKICMITPSQGGECVDSTNGIRVVVPPGAFGTGTDAATLTIKQTTMMVAKSLSGVKPMGKNFDFSAVDPSGTKLTNFNPELTLEFTQPKADLIVNGADTKTEIDILKISLWSENLKDYDTLMTAVEYLDGSNNIVNSPAENLSNVTSIRFKALTSHFSGGGPGQGGDSMAPAAPTGVTGTGSASQIAVSWTAVTTNADGSSPLSDLSDYRIWRSTSASSGFSVIGTAASSTNSYTDSSASAGTTYYYRVTARDTSSNESAQSSSSSGASRTTVSVSGGGGSYTPAVTTTSTTATSTTATTTTTAATSTSVTSSSAGTTSVITSKVFAKFTKLLKKGLKNKEVKNLQEFLAQYPDIYPEGLTSGYFGVATEKAIKKFQEKYGIAKSGDTGYGLVGPATRAKINEFVSGKISEIAKGSSGAAASAPSKQEIKAKIETLQKMLIELLSQLTKILLEKKNAQ